MSYPFLIAPIKGEIIIKRITESLRPSTAEYVWSICQTGDVTDEQALYRIILSSDDSVADLAIEIINQIDTPIDHTAYCRIRSLKILHRLLPCEIDVATAILNFHNFFFNAYDRFQGIRKLYDETASIDVVTALVDRGYLSETTSSFYQSRRSNYISQLKMVMGLGDVVAIIATY